MTPTIRVDDPRWIRVAKRTGKKAPRFVRVWLDTSTAAINARAVRIALAELGTTEHPAGSNRQRYGKEWRQDGVAWCGLAVASWWRRAGHTIPRELALQIDYVPTLVELARRKRHRLSIVHVERVRAGDAVAYDFDGGEADHVGLFVRWIDRDAGTFLAIEGNTAVGDDANGGMVMLRERHTSQVEAFVRKMRG